jgi:hypothetical protein
MYLAFISNFQTYISSVITTAQWTRASFDVPSSLVGSGCGFEPRPLIFRETLFSDEAETDFSLKQCAMSSERDSFAKGIFSTFAKGFLLHKLLLKVNYSPLRVKKSRSYDMGQCDILYVPLILQQIQISVDQPYAGPGCQRLHYQRDMACSSSLDDSSPSARHVFVLASSSGLRGRRRTYLTILKRACSANSKMVG